MKTYALVAALGLAYAAAFSAPAEAVCVLKMEISQTTYSLSISEYIKNKANAAEFEIAVDPAYYKAVNVGQNLQDNMRWGSVVLRGSFGHWNIKVKEKRAEGECNG